MSATLTLALPHAPRPTRMTITAPTTQAFTRRVAQEIRAYAKRRGVSHRAVDYEIIRGRR